MKTNCCEKKDPYLRQASEIKPPLGMSAHDAARRLPGPSLTRTFEMTNDTQEKDYPKSQDHILCRGAAVGLDESGICTHMTSDLSFLGFMEAQTATRAGVRVRGSILLKIPGVTDARDGGNPVYCDGPNSFSLEKKRGSAEIGKIRFCQNGKAAVAFKRFDDAKPLNLDVRNV